MFVKSPQISPFPEQFFSPNLAILQSTNWTLKEFAWLVLGATKRKHDGIGRGRRALKSQILSGSQGASGAGRTGILGRGLCLPGRANAPQEGTGTSSWLPPG